MTIEQMNDTNIEQEGNQKEARKRIEAIYWASVFVWAGLIFGADSLGFLPEIGQSDAWSWVFLGAGAFATLGNLYRVGTPNYPNPTAWDWVWGGIFIILGLGGFIAFNISWPLILILIGVAILVSALWGRQ